MVYYLWFLHIYVPNLICNGKYSCDNLIFLITNRCIESFKNTNQKHSNPHNSDLIVDKFDFIAEGIIVNRMIPIR